MALPPDCWWSDDDARDVSHLRYHGVCKAIVVPGRVTICGPGGDLVGHCGSRAQGKRHVERWLAAHGVPLFDRRAARERMRERAVERAALASLWAVRPVMAQPQIQRMAPMDLDAWALAHLDTGSTIRGDSWDP